MPFQFRSFRARILAFVVGLLVLVQGAVLLAVHAANLRGAQGHVHEALELTAAAFRRSLRGREEILVERARLLSADFAFKRVIATRDRATILSTLENHRARVRADVMMALELSGAVVADTLHPNARGTHALLAPLIAKAMEDEFGEASSIEVLDGVPYQLVVVPFFDPEPSAWILIGFRIDDAYARMLQAETGTQVTLLKRRQASWEVLCSTLEPSLRDALRAELSLPSGHEILHLELAGDDYVSWVAPMEELGPGLVAVLQRSLSAALEPFLRLRTMLVVIFSFGILLSLGAVSALASRVTQPVADLGRGARRIQRGDYTQPVQVSQRDELGDLAESFNAMMRGLAERDQVRDMLGRVVAPEIAEELLARDVELGGEERRVTVLFADVRGFTRLAEIEDAQRLVRILNIFLTALSRAIDEQGGVVEEYMGDGAKAIFGAPVAHEDDPLRAVRAALSLRAALPAVNAEIASFGAAPLEMGIGIHTAEVVAGRMGSLSRLKYTVVGDGVNLASRLEGLTRRYPVTIVVSAATRDACPEILFRELDRVRVRGRAAPVRIFEPLGAEGSVDAGVRELARLHEEALEHLRARDWDAAAAGFEALRRRDPGTALYDVYLERIAGLRADPPGPDWDGTVSPDPG